ncbi:putative nuclear pore complex subunit [Rosellinia necatrix]|uniref:Putative nuclear pore complex subunit n=1 Tax=Rosellinia necatrix TaxID=77044 RepID=A0A1W2TEL8_ROSNE|nr:putative nuclear pore complex subunit [Rosellinia necatrix]
MADDGTMEAFQALHRDLTTVADALKEDRENRGRLALAELPDNPLLEAVANRFLHLLEKPGRKKESRDSVLSGKVRINDEDWTLNKDFQEIILQVADDLDLDEIEATRLALQAEEEEERLGRSRKECTIIRFHQQRKYLLSCMLLLLELSKEEEELLADDDNNELGGLTEYVQHNILRSGSPGAVNAGARPRVVPACATALVHIRAWIQKLSDQVNGAAMLGRVTELQTQETYEFTHISLMQQHELLAVILCYTIERHMAVESDFLEFIRGFRRVVRYDYSIVHLIPVLGAYITMFGSTEGSGSVEQARKLNAIICQQSETPAGALPFLDAAIRAWWIAEYSGWYMEDAAGSSLANVDLDEEDIQRSKQFTEALKDGAFDFLLTVIIDVKTTEWQDHYQNKLRGWAQKRTPALPPDTVPFSSQLQGRAMARMEMFIDAFISNMPDVLRKLKIDEDEQRQAGQHQQQDIDLERFLLLIAYSYEGRPEAADAFWADPESNLAGFLQWASRRTTTPLQTTFCEMLQCLSDDSESATYAHEFLLDEGHQLRRPSSITWVHILKELEYYVIAAKTKPAGSQATALRAHKLDGDRAESEAEILMLQEAYLRLIAKLTSQSEPCRIYLLQLQNERLVVLLMQIISSAVGHQIRAYAFRALSGLMARKSLAQSHSMWSLVESCFTGSYISSSVTARTQGSTAGLPNRSSLMEALFREMSPDFEDMSSFIQFLTVLSSLPDGLGPLNDALPYSENLGASTRTRPGIEPYIDFVLGHIFSMRVPESREVTQQRVLRYHCLDFALACVCSFNEDLIVFSNESNINVDSAIRAKDLETYVSLHPFARVMEWMYDSKFTKAILDTIHQSSSDIGKAAPDSPLILGVLRAIELLSKALDLQATFLDLVRPIVKPQNRVQSRSSYTPTSNGAFASIEDGLMTSITLVSDLGSYCGIGHPSLTTASLKLLEKLSTSPRVISAWQSDSLGRAHRNKGIVALEENGDAQAIAGAFTSELTSALDFRREADSPDYQIKVCILDFLYSCLKTSPDRPTIAHLLLGFRCTANSLEIEPGSAFEQRSALFHSLLPIIVEAPANNEEGVMLRWLVVLKYKVMRIFKLLWSSSLSSRLVLGELRDNDFLFYILLQGLVTHQSSIWDGQEANGPDFLTSPSAQGFVDYLSMRAMALEYIAHELCSVAQGEMPALKRRIFDALGGQIVIEGMESIAVPSVFEFHDSLPQEDLFAAPPPQLTALGDLDLRACLEADDDSNQIYNLDKVREVLLLKRNEGANSNQVILQQDAALLDMEEGTMLLYAVYLNRLTQTRTYSLTILRAWTRLLMVMTDCNDFKGANKVSFILQTLQATLPGLEIYGSEKPGPAVELAKLAKVVLFNLDFTTMSSPEKSNRTTENLISDKLFQLFQTCLNAIAKWVASQELRAIYYSLCHRYLAGLLDHSHEAPSGLQRAAKTIQSFGEKLLNVVCDDAFGGDPRCQSAALVLLATLVQLGRNEGDYYVVEALNKLNFIGIVVDSLRDVMQEWIEINRNGSPDHQNYLNAKLVLLLQLCQTRQGAKYVLHANIFRAVEQSNLFEVDPELQVDPADAKALEIHYLLLVKVARIISVAILSRGSHNILQGRRFLADHRILVTHVLKRSAGIGSGAGKMGPVLAERIDDLAEAFMIMITATGFLEFDNQTLTEDPKSTPMLFH